MPPTFLSCVRRLGAVLFLTALVACPVAGRADTVASLLGNFTINQYCGVQIARDAVTVHYTAVFGQLPALRELHLADGDGDGVTSQAERDAYVARLAPAIAEQLRVIVDGAPVALRATRWTTSLPTEQGGFSLRIDVDFAGALPAETGDAQHAGTFANQNYAGQFGWQEIVVRETPPMKVYATDAFDTSLTNGLSDAVQAMPASGPLNERAVRLSYTAGAPPAGAQRLQPRPGTAAPAAASAAPTSDVAAGDWLQRQTRRLIGMISTPDVAPHVALLALLAAVVLGALHAFSPGHGKTVVGAYLIGSRATARHALFLGATVTITHTLGVFALGFATLVASRYILPERLFPVLALISGLLVLGMGVVLLVQRWGAARDVVTAWFAGKPGFRAAGKAAIAYRSLARATPMRRPAGQFVLAYAHDHAHANGHGHSHSHDALGMHSHGGAMHSHLPPGAAGEAVTWRSLLALGISGGLVPCPSAMVLLLAAIALNKTAYGMLLVVAFSAGLAATLAAVGLAFLYARNRLRAVTGAPRWTQVVPVLSAGVITVVGVLLCYGALSTAPY